VVINNSNSREQSRILGLYHKATIIEPDLNEDKSSQFNDAGYPNEWKGKERDWWRAFY
jgi:hypothetical protein